MKVKMNQHLEVYSRTFIWTSASPATAKLPHRAAVDSLMLRVNAKDIENL